MQPVVYFCMECKLRMFISVCFSILIILQTNEDKEEYTTEIT